MNWVQAQTRFLVRQRVTLMANKYEVHSSTADGQEEHMVAFAQQKRLAFKEQVTLYTDASKQYVLGGFRARQRIDLGATYDITDHNGTPIGTFRKDFKRSLTSSTYHLEQPGLGVTTGTERNQTVAVLRRIWGFIPYLSDLPFAWPYHFDFTAGGTHPVFSVVKKFGFRDRYVVDIHDPRIDRRLVIAMAVGLDALQSR
ncbi:LURP-one-related/scramblase family protein [Actinocorallia lasiicapitis]